MIESRADGDNSPNVILILTDNQGAWTLGCYGNPDIETPHIDRLAAEGARFTNAFSNNAVCSPTRATYLTGLTCSQHGVHNFLGGGRLQTGPEARNTLEEFTSLPEVLDKNGYACGLVGKWHLGNNLHPNEALDDYWITMPHGGTSTFHGAEVIENGEIRTEEEYLTEFWTRHALTYLEQRAAEPERPFFLYLAYNGPYGLSRFQLQPSGNRWQSHYADKDLPSFPRGVIHPWEYNNREYFGNPVSIRRYAEEVGAIDDGVGAIMEKLEALGLAENTVVVFAADQGWAGGQHGLWGMGDHTRPINAREHSMRIPMIFWHRGKILAGTPGQFVSNYDFMPTMLGYLGMARDWPEKEKSPGTDFSSLLRTGQPVGKPDEIYYEYESLRCVRTPEWKYVERYGDGYDELYRIDRDPGELHNLIDSEEHAPMRSDLAAKLAAWFAKHSTEKYDLWKGGGSQPRLLVWGEEARQRQRERAKKPGGAAPAAVALDFDPPPFVLPDGLVAEVAAAPPLVQHPTMAAFDDRGRLFVADNAGLNLKKEELEKQRPNSIRLLEDTNDDGLFDKSTVFADGMTFPQGALWLMDALYVMSPPSLWRLEDTDGDGVADAREELVTGFDYTGNAADVHGPFLHPNGRIFWCHGRKGHEVFDPATGNLVDRGKGARIWSCRPDGSDVQVFAGGGMDNPVEIDFTDEGEIVGSVNLFYGRPRGDVLVHWQYGGAYPRRDQEAVLSEFKRTGPLLTEIHNFGHVAVSGMTRCRSGSVNPEWKDNWLVTHFNTGKITRTAVERDGATFRAAGTETILEIESPDAHITDVLEDPRGDLLALDTGGWFRIGCPTSQVAKPEVPGAIYRIRKAGVRDQGLDPFGNRIDWETAEAGEIAKHLDAESFAVRERAMTELAVLGAPALPELEAVLGGADSSVTARRNAVWTLARIRFSDSPDLIRTALADADATVRQAACEAIAATRNWQAVAANTPDEARIEISRNAAIAEVLIERLRGDVPPVQRAAAVALGRMAMPNAVGPLLGVAGRDTTDRSLRHAAIYALIGIGDAEATRPGLESENPRRVSAALLALDQMDANTLPVLSVLGFLESKDETVRSTAAEIAARHSEWDGAVANLFHDWLDAGKLSETQLGLFRQLAPGYLGTPPMQSLIGTFLNSDDPAAVRAGFEAIADAVEATFHESWEAAFRKALESEDPDVKSRALEALENLGGDRFGDELAAIAADENAPPMIRVRALRAGLKPDAALSDTAFGLLGSRLKAAASPAERLEAAQLMGDSRLPKPQLLLLAPLLRSAGPLELPLLLQPFFRSKDPEVGRALAEVLPASPGIGNVPVAELKRLAGRFPAEDVPAVTDLISGLETRAGQRAQRLAALAPRLGNGVAEKGRKLFLEGRGACVTCHRIGDQGGEVGPNLSAIGEIRTSRDLLESILYPSDSLARDFETFQVQSRGGGLLMGLIRGETRDAIRLIDPAGQEHVIARAEVESVAPLPVSIMPQGLDFTMTEAELIDLIAFLKSGKPPG